MLLSVVVRLTWAQDSVFLPCFPPTIPQPGTPFAPQGPRGSVPPFRRYCEVLRLPTARLAALRCPSRDDDRPVRLSSLRRGPTPTARPGALRLGRPYAHCFRIGDGRISQVPGKPMVPMPCSRTPVRSTHQAATVRRRGPRLEHDEGSHSNNNFRGSIPRPGHSLSTLRPAGCPGGAQDSLPAAG